MHERVSLGETAREIESGREVARELRTIEDRTLEVPGAMIAGDRRDIAAGDVHDGVRKLSGRRGRTGSDVQDVLFDFALQGERVGQRHVPDVDVVAHAAVVTVRGARIDSERAPGEHAVDEDGDDARFAMRILAGTEDVRVAERRRREAALAPVDAEELLERELVDRVRT